MGRMCPKCGYLFQEDIILPKPVDYCQHEFFIDNSTPQATYNTTIKWRCRKCLEVRYTSD